MSKGLICLLRMQDLTGKDDEFCMTCWADSMEDYYFSSVVKSGPAFSYVDRSDCAVENCVTEEEYDELPKRRYPEPLSAFKVGKDKGT